MTTSVTSLPLLAKRPPDSHKGSFGHVLIVAGSRGMSGAAVLCGSAALRGGAGLVSVATPEIVLPIVAAGNPCYLTAPLPADEQGRVAAAGAAVVIEQAPRCSVLAIGPGLGQSAGVAAVVRQALEQVAIPIVLDADALNTLASLPSWPVRDPAWRLILTPHPGEFGRLLKVTAADVQQAREDLAVEFARAHRIILVLKGHETLVTDGERLYRNQTGNPGMASGGTGDVLTGLIAALLAQQLAAFDAAQLGVYLHGLAGDLARDDQGEVSLIASDLLDHLPAAFQQHAQRGSPSFGFRA